MGFFLFQVLSLHRAWLAAPQRQDTSSQLFPCSFSKASTSRSMIMPSCLLFPLPTTKMDRYSHTGNSNNPPHLVYNCTSLVRSLTTYVIFLYISFYRLILGSFLSFHCAIAEVIAKKPMGTLQIPKSLWSSRYMTQLLASDCSLIAIS